MDTVWKLIESAIPQFVIALLVWGVMGYLAIVQGAIPEEFKTAGLIILGFYFGSVAVGGIKLSRK